MKQLFIDAWNFFKTRKIRILFNILVYISLFFFGRSLYVGAYCVGYKRGLNKGYNIALDTVNSILYSEQRSDTNHCSHIIVDTSYYILHHK